MADRRDVLARVRKKSLDMSGSDSVVSSAMNRRNSKGGLHDMSQVGSSMRRRSGERSGAEPASPTLHRKGSSNNVCSEVGSALQRRNSRQFGRDEDESPKHPRRGSRNKVEPEPDDMCKASSSEVRSALQRRNSKMLVTESEPSPKLRKGKTGSDFPSNQSPPAVTNDGLSNSSNDHTESTRLTDQTNNSGTAASNEDDISRQTSSFSGDQRDTQQAKRGSLFSALSDVSHDAAQLPELSQVRNPDAKAAPKTPGQKQGRAGPYGEAQDALSAMIQDRSTKEKSNAQSGDLDEVTGSLTVADIPDKIAPITDLSLRHNTTAPGTMDAPPQRADQLESEPLTRPLPSNGNAASSPRRFRPVQSPDSLAKQADDDEVDLDQATQLVPTSFDKLTTPWAPLPTIASASFFPKASMASAAPAIEDLGKPAAAQSYMKPHVDHGAKHSGGMSSVVEVKTTSPASPTYRQRMSHSIGRLFGVLTRSSKSA